jgi:hypothetical protein
MAQRRDLGVRKDCDWLMCVSLCGVRAMVQPEPRPTSETGFEIPCAATRVELMREVVTGRDFAPHREPFLRD